MIIRKIIFVISFILMLSCRNKNLDYTNSSAKQKYEEENFNDFFKKFTTDSMFQCERIKFPFILKTLDIYGEKLIFDTIISDNWEFTSFEYQEGYGGREIDAYTQETKIYSDSVKIELRGVDNGIHIDFEFYKENGKWFLLSEKDLSN